MKIVNILGGLGNQMFQYAFAVVLKKKFPKDQIRIYTHAFNGYPLHNGYELNNIFNLSIDEATDKEVTKVYWPIFNHKLWRFARKYLPARKGFKESNLMPITEEDINRCQFFDGYFQRAYYFDYSIQDILSEFKFPEIKDESNLKIIEIINIKESASIHIRRGDYLADKNYGGICTLTYYKNALDVLSKTTNTKQLLVFSNDLDWVKDNMAKYLEKFEVIYVDWNNGIYSFRDMDLMSRCHHNIVANSSFSWWGAFLNRHKDKKVFCPIKWTHSNKNPSVVPNEWIKIEID